MKFRSTLASRIVLEKAEAAVRQTAREIRYAEDEQESFKLLWRLAFLELRDLEDFRIPGDS